MRPLLLYQLQVQASCQAIYRAGKTDSQLLSSETRKSMMGLIHFTRYAARVALLKSESLYWISKETTKSQSSDLIWRVREGKGGWVFHVR